MAREVVLRVWCDVCKGRGRGQVEGKEFTMDFGNGKAKTLALCEVDEKELYEPLFDAWSRLAVADVSSGLVQAKPARGRPSRAKAPSGEEVGDAEDREVVPETGECPACHEYHRALGGHWRRSHQTEARQTLAQALGLPTPYACDLCPLAYTNGAGISQHMRSGQHLGPLAA